MARPAPLVAPPAPAKRASATAELAVGGMHCSACATRIQRALVGRPEVLSASVNLATGRAFVTFEPEASSPAALAATVEDLGYRASEVADAGSGPAEGHDPAHWGPRVALAWPLALGALAVAFAAPETPAAGWCVLALAATVEVVGGWPFLASAARLARHRSVSMDTLISVGTLAALAVSAVEAVALGGVHLHTGGPGAFAARLHGVMAPLIVAVLATGRLVESQARRRAASALHSLLSLRPPVARLVATVEDEEGIEVAPESIPVGALVRVRAGEAVPLDGEVVAGHSAVDESMLTGEAMPVERGPGSSVTGGTRNGSGTLVVRVEAVATESVLARLQRLVEEAQRHKPPLERLADRVSAIFVPAVLVLALATFGGWLLLDHNAGTAALAAVAVLLVACPCAMGLAAPVAVMVGTGRAAALGIVVRSGEALERLGRADTVAFDKTGTLTERAARVTAVVPAGSWVAEEVLALAAAVEGDSDHPVALALTEAAPENRPGPVVDGTEVPGRGVAGMVGGHLVEVGPPGNLPEELAKAAAARAAKGETVVAVRRDGEVLGVVALATPLRPEARSAVEDLHRLGARTTVLSGDAEPAVAAAAAGAGIENHASGLDPAAKLEELRRLQQGGRLVVMVGDGVNDAPALAAASVGCAVGHGSEAALAESDVALLRGDLRGVPAALALSRAVTAVITQNFGWAMGYNLAALPLAAAGLLDPLVAAVAMGLSSLLVVVNSLRLLRLGRRGAEAVAPPRLRGFGAFALSVLVPVALFGGATVAAEAVSPSRGQPLLPTLPSVTEVTLRHGVGAEMYLGNDQAGVNQFHFFVVPPTGRSVAFGEVRATATRSGAEPVSLRLVRLSPDHFIAYSVFGPGHWHFEVSLAIDGQRVRATMNRQLG